MSIARKLVAGLAPLVLLAVSPCHGQAEDKIRIGVREDAPPFVWRNEDTHEYVGFFWSICTEAVRRAGFQIETAPLGGATERGEFFKTGKGDYDLLCDPTTITIERMRTFMIGNDGSQASRLSFSPIVFVANSSSVEPGRGGVGKGRGGHVGASSGSTCESVFNKLAEPEAAPTYSASQDGSQSNAGKSWYSNFDFILVKRPVPKPKLVDYEVWGYVDGSTVGNFLDQLRPKPGEKNICLRPLTSYTEAAEEFCEGRLSRFFGDVDIINAVLAHYRERNNIDCPAEPVAGYRAYEPYAFVLSTQHHKAFPERFTFALYEMFKDGTMEGFFRGNFPDTPKSQDLKMLFDINGVPVGIRSPDESPSNGLQKSVERGSP